eukprot:g19382.t1
MPLYPESRAYLLFDDVLSFFSFFFFFVGFLAGEVSTASLTSGSACQYAHTALASARPLQLHPKSCLRFTLRTGQFAAGLLAITEKHPPATSFFFYSARPMGLMGPSSQIIYPNRAVMQHFHHISQPNR